MEDIAYYRWLDSPFTTEEQAELARIEHKHQLVQELSGQVVAVVRRLRAFYSAWPRRRWSIYKLDKLTPKTSRRASGITFRLDPSRFNLTAGESEYWPRLLEKQNRPAFLSPFQDSPDKENGFIARLKREMREMSANSAINKYLNTELDLFNRNHAAYLKSFEPDEDGRDRRPADRGRHYLTLKIRERRAEEFRQYIANELAKLDKENILLPATHILKSQKEETQSEEQLTPILSHRQIALLYIYNDQALPPDEAKCAAQKYGYYAPSSGRSIRQDYNKYGAINSSNRKNVDSAALIDMIADVTTVIPHLTGAARQQAENELQALKDKR